MEYESCYVSCNCNQTPTAAHWGTNDLICYAACNAVNIYDPKWGSGGKVIATLVGHTKRVNSVRWLLGRNNDTELVSGSTDHTAIVWTLRGAQYTLFVLKGHASNVNLVEGLYKGDMTIVVTVGMDSTIIIWTRFPSEEFVIAQVINTGYSICVGVRMSFLPYLKIMILACAMDNSNIDLYVAEGQFNHSLSLKGHEDWVRGLDFTVDDKGDLLLASCSQDCYIRLWRIKFNQSDSENVIKTRGGSFGVFVDSILTGHEGWVYSVNWSINSLQLLSASLDKSMIIWELDPETNLWVDKMRVGEVGGNTLGFYGGVFSPDGNSILGHGYNGAFHVWTNNNGEWEPCVTVGGHFREVTDLAWEPRGEFLVTVSHDQTTRIHAPWSKSDRPVTWHEIARPQTRHGRLQRKKQHLQERLYAFTYPIEEQRYRHRRR
jgi:elongator complex protein 2